MITVEAIRHKYPHPVKFSYMYAANTDKYCTGGACIKFAGITLPNKAAHYEHVFPAGSSLAWALCQINPALDAYKAAMLAGHILDKNDAEQFELAWAYLDEALTYHPSPGEAE